MMQGVEGGALVTPEALRRHVEMLASTIGERNVYRPQALNAAAEYIRTQWDGYGYDVVTQEYLARGVSSLNLEISRNGEMHPERILLMGAHYDSVDGSPGANDNGSGVAALLEISRLFASVQPNITVRFVAFTNEEPPFFFWNEMGSLVYAKAARKRGDDIRLMIALETIGYFRDEAGSQAYPPIFRYFHPDTGNFLAFVSNWRSRRMLLDAIRAFRAHSDFPVEHTATFSWVPGVAWSDHYSFWRNGYRALMVTDTAFYRYPHYHLRSDTPEKLDYVRLAKATDALYRMLGTLADGMCS